MIKNRHFLAATTAALIHLLPVVLANPKSITPCAKGAGGNNGCSECSSDKSIKVTPWNRATKDPNFNVPNTESESGGGYDVWWSIADPDPGCRILVTQPYITEQGSIIANLSGNVVLSVTHGGCFYTKVTSSGVAASFCCGDGDCATAGAIPGGAKEKREMLPSRITRALRADTRKTEILQRTNAWDGVPLSPKAITCSSPRKVGGVESRTGRQQIDGNTLSCDGGEGCSSSLDMETTADVSVENEHSTEISTSNGVSVAVSAGFFMIDGPTAEVTTEYSHEWSHAVGQSLAVSKSQSVTKSQSLDYELEPGQNFNLWFSPYMNCQEYTLKCNGVQQSLRKCWPKVDSDGKPEGQHGVMTIG